MGVSQDATEVACSFYERCNKTSTRCKNAGAGIVNMLSKRQEIQMNLCSDCPINTKREDRLDRACFSESLAKMICSITQKEAITIGLHGKWGSGKTSAINMTLETIEELSKDAGGSSPVIVRFEPWDYIDDKQLMQQFFRTLTSSLSLGDGNKAMQVAGKALEDYAKAAEFLEVLPSVGQLFKIVNAVSGRAGTRLLEKGKGGSRGHRFSKGEGG